jgi:hypothetical protein
MALLSQAPSSVKAGHRVASYLGDSEDFRYSQLGAWSLGICRTREQKTELTSSWTEKSLTLLSNFFTPRKLPAIPQKKVMEEKSCYAPHLAPSHQLLTSLAAGFFSGPEVPKASLEHLERRCQTVYSLFSLRVYSKFGWSLLRNGCIRGQDCQYMLVGRTEQQSAGGWDPSINLYCQWQWETISLSGDANNAILTKISLYIDLKLLKLRENEFTLEIFVTQDCQSVGANQRLSSRRKNASEKQVKCSCEIRPIGKWNLF